MNLIELLSNELKDKHLTEFEKTRHIYLRCCEIFSFDTRWYYTYLFDDDKLKEEIKTRQFNVENIITTLVVCHSNSKYILKPTIEYLTNLEVELHEGGHSYLMLKYGDEYWRLDATIGDLARVKMGLTTEGFTSNSLDYKKILTDVDQELKREYKGKEYYYDRLNYDSFATIIKSVSRLLSESACKYHYSDASHFYTSLAGTYSKKDMTYTDDKYNFIRLIKLMDDYSHYMLHKQSDEYKLDEISEEEYLTLTRTMRHE